MQKQKGLFLIFIIAGMVFLSCGKEAPKIAYLNPSDFQSEGFLDPSTYQIVENGIFFDNDVVAPEKRYFVPCSPPAAFDTEDIKDFNIQNKRNRKAEKDLFCYIRQVQEYNFPLLDEESNNVNKSNSGIFKNERIREILELRDELYKRSCSAAKVRALYKWYMKINDKKLLNQFLDHSGFHPKAANDKNNDKPVRSDFILLDNFESNLFPPAFWFTGNSLLQLKRLNERLTKDGIRWEVIEEQRIFSPNLMCRVIIHIHRDLIAVDYPLIHPH